MGNENDNRRVRYTKMVLKESLLHLMETNPINKITVTDICKEADINRGTFYLHYYDPYDLLEKIQDELFQEIIASVDKLMKGNANSTLLIKEIFELIAKNGDLCRIIFSDNGDKDFLRKIINLTKEKVINEWLIMFKKTNIQDIEYLYLYTSNGIIGIIQHWIQKGCTESAEKISRFVDQLSKDSINSLLKHSY